MKIILSPRSEVMRTAVKSPVSSYGGTFSMARILYCFICPASKPVISMQRATTWDGVALRGSSIIGNPPSIRIGGLDNSATSFAILGLRGRETVLGGPGESEAQPINARTTYNDNKRRGIGLTRHKLSHGSGERKWRHSAAH